MISIVDYGVGNLFSLKCSLAAIGEEVTVTGDPQALRRSGKLILPGVGAFQDAADKLRSTGLDALIREGAARGKPILGICLGMQLLFEKSYEFGEHRGLGLIPGTVVPMAGFIPEALKIPHIGWNALRLRKESPLFRYIQDGDFVYFVHSFFAAQCDSYVIADTEYGQTLTAAVQKENVYGCQFHPEKSGNVGLNILRAFAQLEDCPC